MAAPRQPVEFNHLEPKAFVTNPDGIGIGQPYPRHVHRFVAAGVMNEYRVVHSDAERDAALEDGFSLQPQMTAPIEDASGDADPQAETPTRKRRAA